LNSETVDTVFDRSHLTQREIVDRAQTDPRVGVVGRGQVGDGQPSVGGEEPRSDTAGRVDRDVPERGPFGYEGEHPSETVLRRLDPACGDVLDDEEIDTTDAVVRCADVSRRCGLTF
jgi:hypothetical protein